MADPALEVVRNGAVSFEAESVIHVDETRALQPLERWAREESDMPETYPTGM